jgi:hypothetical protein
MAAVVHEVPAIRRDRWFFDKKTRFRKACDRLQRSAIRWHPKNVAVAWLNRASVHLVSKTGAAPAHSQSSSAVLRRHLRGFSKPAKFPLCSPKKLPIGHRVTTWLHTCRTQTA